jgi:two-component system OmpR family sensor kinase
VKHISVTTFIHILFSIAIAILAATLYLFITTSQEKNKSQDIERYKFIAETLGYNLRLSPPEEKIQKFFRDFQLRKVPSDAISEEVQKKGETMLFVGDPDAPDVRIFKLGENRYYIYVDMPGYRMMLVDNRVDQRVTEIATIVGVVLFLLLVILYYMVLKKLYPLKKLHHQIEQFAAGDLDVKIAYDSHDEIGKIARSFDRAIAHIHQLMKSKNLFMRNIMHELKTPITKGRIIAETIDDETAKGFLIKAFERMNELISDLADIERITMHTFKPTMEDIFLQDVLLRTEKILLTDPKYYTVRVDDRPIHTDIKLLALALKNLMDNGIKYSPSKHVTLTSVGNRLEIRSQGDPLKEDFTFYIEPFSQEEKRSHGFGLGLYIVHNILEKLGYEFRYAYDKGTEENVFSIVIND